jgi:hypothetical protein
VIEKRWPINKTSKGVNSKYMKSVANEDHLSPIPVSHKGATLTQMLDWPYSEGAHL